uniref:Reverse transcriptase/retrotransposon-derived protein RNase H-like domain-containing protein n=1 Tax=Lactuca sativa TaxID=4236 RepID=A0A9R1XDW4_LACSA|nr:hypothetical protein LSAT_V11C500280930 [Lactuca sativa]
MDGGRKKIHGYYITKEGIQPNPSKIKDLLETNPPRNLKEMQGLNGKITTLECFISKSANKAMPLFQTLKGCIDKSNFRWTGEAEQALEPLNTTLRKLPMLASPIPCEKLSIYLATS